MKLLKCLEFLLRFFPSINAKLEVYVEIITEAQSFPEGTVPGVWKIYLEKNGSQDHYYEGPEPWTTFDDVTPGPYTAFGVRVDADDERLGELISLEINLQPNLF